MFHKGDIGDKFYIIIDGEASVRIFNREFEIKNKELYTQQVQLRKLIKQRADIK